LATEFSWCDFSTLLCCSTTAETPESHDDIRIISQQILLRDVRAANDNRASRAAGPENRYHRGTISSFQGIVSLLAHATIISSSGAEFPKRLNSVTTIASSAFF
jgi:hypothetical protein